MGLAALQELIARLSQGDDHPLASKGVVVTSKTLGLFLRLLGGLFFLHGLSRLFLGFLFAVHAFAHDSRSLMIRL